MTAQQLPSTVPSPGRYRIDPGSSAVSFRTRHLFGLAPVRGRFAIRRGTVDITDPPAGSRADAEIDAASFRTGNDQRDRHVRSAALLDTGRHPVISFSSGRLDGTDLTGTLTVRGVTRPVTLDVQEPSLDPGGFSLRATTRIDRTDFGVTGSRGLAGRYLTLTLEIRCVRA
jgi:polyisoprenoid-binding protein YceI